MSRYNSRITMFNETVTVGDNGVPSVTRSNETTIFANRLTRGFASRLAAKEYGLKADASVQVRSCDYHGQSKAVFENVEYEIEDVSDSGEFTQLSLARRLSNE